MTTVPEKKFALMMGMCGGICQFDMGVGRGRPLPRFTNGPWYAQKIHNDLELPELIRDYKI